MLMGLGGTEHPFPYELSRGLFVVVENFKWKLQVLALAAVTSSSVNVQFRNSPACGEGEGALQNPVPVLSEKVKEHFFPWFRHHKNTLIY